jgi:hypothetical protein
MKLQYILLIILIIALVLLGPFLTIWSLNTLFPVLNIAYGIDTWAAIIILGVAVRGTKKITKD